MVDPVIYDALDFYEDKKCDTESLRKALVPKYGAEALEEACSDIEELIAADMLFSDDEVSTEIFEKKQPVIKAMCLHVAHDCNMNCAYCFGDKGAFEGIRCLLTPEMGKKALDFLMKNSGSRRNLEIDFFGGEPLMNFDVVKELVAYGRAEEGKYGKNIRFTITTNGMLLDDAKIEYINEVMDNVILSIDGRPEVNDRMRKTVNGRGTYDIILKNYKNFISKREGLYYVRGTFTRYNLDFAEDVKHLLDQGFQNVSVEPVVTSQEYDYALRDEDTERILTEYDRLSDMYLEKALKGEPFDFFHFNVDLDQGPCVIKRVSGCGAGYRSTWRCRRKAISIRVTSLWEIHCLSWAIWMTKNSKIECSISSTARISTIKKSAETAGRSSTAAADAMPTRIRPTAAFWNRISWAVNWKRRESNAPSAFRLFFQTNLKKKEFYRKNEETE